MLILVKQQLILRTAVLKILKCVLIHSIYITQHRKAGLSKRKRSLEIVFRTYIVSVISYGTSRALSENSAR